MVSNSLGTSSEKPGRGQVYLLFSCLFCIIAACIFWPFWTRGISFVYRGDGYDQYYAALAYIGYYGREFISCLMQGQIRQFDFSIGLGDDVIGTLSYYGFGDPLNWLAIFVAPENTAYLYSFLILLRWYLGGAAFIWYTQRRGMRPIGTLLGAMAYSFCPYLLNYNMLFAAGYGNIMYLLPMAFGGVDDLLEQGEKRFSSLLMAAIGLQALCGYYFLYMESILLVVYFLVRYYCLALERRVLARKENATEGNVCRNPDDNHAGGRYFICRVLYCTLSYLAGIAAGAVILLPSIGYFLQSSRTDWVSISIAPLLEQYDISYYLTALEKLFLPSPGNVFGFPVLLLPAVLLLFRRDNCYRDAKWLLIIALVMYCSKGVSYVMSAFAYYDRRWTFFLFYAAALAIAAAADQIGEMSERMGVLAAGSYLLWAVCCCVRLNLVDGIGKRTLLWRYGVPFLLLIAELAAARLMKSKQSTSLQPFVVRTGRWQRILPQMMLLAIMAGNLIWFGLQWTGRTPADSNTKYYSFYSYAELKENYELSATNTSEDQENEEEVFYRVDAWDAGENGGLLHHANTTGEYFSVINSSVGSFWEQLEISPGIRREFAYIGLDTRLDLEALLSVRYSRSYQGGERVGDRNEVADFLPLGIFYSDSEVMSAAEAEDIAPIDLGGLLLQAMVLGDDTLIAGSGAVAADYELYSRENVSYTLEIADAVWTTDGNALQANAGAQILLHPQWSEDNISDLTDTSDYTGVIYVRMTGFLYGGTVSKVTVNGNEISTNMADDFLVHVEIIDPEEPIVIELPEAGTYTIGNIEIIVQDMSILPEQVQLRSEHCLTETVIGVNMVQGQVEAEEDGWVFFSIPYLDYWAAYVDGVRTNIAVADYAFIAIPVTEGTHQIVLQYSNPWFNIGLCMTVCSAIMSIMMLWRRRRKRILKK